MCYTFPKRVIGARHHQDPMGFCFTAIDDWDNVGNADEVDEEHLAICAGSFRDELDGGGIVSRRSLVDLAEAAASYAFADFPRSIELYA
jgi:hypothetical protein